MIVVKVEIHRFSTGTVEQLGEMRIWNTGHGTDTRGSYEVAVVKDDGKFADPFGAVPKKILRTGYVANYPRLSYHIFRLVLRALKSAFPEEG
jgi:hypothetical protein